MKKLLVLAILAIGLSAQAGKKKHTVDSPEHSVIVINQNTQTVTHQENADVVRSMASITKLMTAMVVLDTQPNLERKIKYNPGYLPSREYSVRELLGLLLVRSDNHVAELLSKSFYRTRDEFIAAMNEKALKLGMLSARFVDPSGILADNSATARDIAKMVSASGTYPTIRDLAGLKEINIEAKQGKHTKQISITNTNKDILFEFNNIVISKTGFTSAAGRCLALLVEKSGLQYAVVILGDPTKQARDSHARRIIYTQLDTKETVVW